MQHSIKIELFMVAPDERRRKVAYQINRPAFAAAEARPFLKIFRIISRSEMHHEIVQIGR